MSDKNCKKCIHFDLYREGQSKYWTLECPYDGTGLERDKPLYKKKYHPMQARSFFEINPNDCKHYTEKFRD